MSSASNCWERFLHACEKDEIWVLLAGVRPDLIDTFGRLRFAEWLPPDRVFKYGVGENSGTNAAIRWVRHHLAQERPPIARKPEAVYPPGDYRLRNIGRPLGPRRQLAWPDRRIGRCFVL